MSYKDLIVVTQTDASVYLAYDLPHVGAGLLKLDSLISLNAETDIETRPALSLGVPYQTGYTTGSMVQAGQMAFPATIESPFAEYIKLVEQQERMLGDVLRNRYLSGPSEWYGEEFLPEFSLLIVYTPELIHSTGQEADVSFVYIPGVRITQRSEDSTPEGLTILLYRFQQRGIFRYKKRVNIISGNVELDVTDLIHFQPYRTGRSLRAVILNVLEARRRGETQ